MKDRNGLYTKGFNDGFMVGTAFGVVVLLLVEFVILCYLIY